MLTSNATATNSKLTTGSVRAMFEGQPMDAPYLQFLQLKVYEKPNGGGVHYKIVVSDGQHFIQGTLTPQLNHLVQEHKLEPFCVAQVLKYSVNQLKDHRLIFISDISTADIAMAPGKIGGPVNVENDPNIPTPNNNNNTTNGNPNTNDMKAPVNPTVMSTTMSADDSATVQPISAISPYHNRWVIKARVGSKTDVKKFTNQKGDGKLFSCTLLDESGEIKMTAFGESVDKFYDMIMPGKVYLISNAACKMSKRQFSNVNNEYEIHLEANSVVQLVAAKDDDKALPQVRYAFTAINQLASTEKDRFVDVIGVLREVADLQSLTAKATGKKLDKRDISLLDMSNAQVRLTLWGQEAITFATPTGSVVAVKGAKVGEYNGAKTLSTVSSTQLDVDPDLPEAHRLRGWHQSGKAASEPVTNVSSGGAGSQSHGDLKPLQAVKALNLGRSPQADYFSTLAAVQHIRSEDNKVWYEACPQEGCSKKVFNDQAGQYRCERCQRQYDHCDYRYILSAQIADHTDSQWVNVFGEQAEALLGVSAKDLAAIKQHDNAEFERIMKDPVTKPFIFRVRAKMESYQGEDRVRLNVIGVSKVDPVKEGMLMISKLNL